MKALLLFAKYPEPGKVKTRLARTVGDGEAARIYREMLEKVVLQTRPLSSEYLQCLCFDPPEKEEAFLRWFTFLNRLSPQTVGSLGARLIHAFQESFAQGDSPVIAAGTDCLDVNRALIVEAFSRLKDHDLVLGPARDGGYYLIGCRILHRDLFENISWSTGAVFQQTMEKASALKLSVSLLETLSDLDE